MITLTEIVKKIKLTDDNEKLAYQVLTGKLTVEDIIKKMYGKYVGTNTIVLYELSKDQGMLYKILVKFFDEKGETFDIGTYLAVQQVKFDDIKAEFIHDRHSDSFGKLKIGPINRG